MLKSFPVRSRCVNKIFPSTKINIQIEIRKSNLLIVCFDKWQDHLRSTELIRNI